MGRFGPFSARTTTTCSAPALRLALISAVKGVWPPSCVATRSPFTQTLVGQVNLATNATTFTGLPDFPLTDLKVKLNGGTKAVFDATCKPPSGSATAALTSQNGDQTKQVVASFTISPCALTNNSSSGSTKPGKAPRIDGASAFGLTTGKPSLVIQISIIDGQPVFVEQILHHPPTSAFEFFGKGFKMWGVDEPNVSISLNSARAKNNGHHHILFENTGIHLIANLPSFDVGVRKKHL